ncbi:MULTISPECIES: helix-turn-helix domain-containing protein [Oceanobacillus]|uniref:HTH cro/C1-type domain-containing protein n=1 Tax=Oceanobacillus kimchii TaxID=746691 RepID=A0ABQ5TQC9_9BACI|nr:helix-turn-helix transcriptional regulator [Oceanobacillus kimchii]GLO68370.1 hypothetical protein MACH08_41540 [Oceanobacillus kimchii]
MGEDKKKNQFAKRIKYLREAKNWSKKELVEMLSINLSTYANWEYGIREPDFDTLIEISKIYNVSADFLLGITNDDYISKEKFLSEISNETLINWYVKIGETGSEKDLEKLYQIYKLIEE